MLPLSEGDQQTLLRLAREAIEQSVRKRPVPTTEPAGEALRQKCGAFVTLHKRGRLRGCIGLVEPVRPLYQTVRECAVSAALDDPRFEPVTPAELPLLQVEISVLSPLFDIAPEEIEIGKHGLLISDGFSRGLLLPQIATEWGWDKERFLEETCLKAGLAPDAWREGARIQAFTAQVFAEKSAPAKPSDHAA
jgi:AmmeMemoRadiSam system protein A